MFPTRRRIFFENYLDANNCDNFFLEINIKKKAKKALELDDVWTGLFESRLPLTQG